MKRNPYISNLPKNKVHKDKRVKRESNAKKFIQTFPTAWDKQQTKCYPERSRDKLISQIQIYNRKNVFGDWLGTLYDQRWNNGESLVMSDLWLGWSDNVASTDTLLKNAMELGWISQASYQPGFSTGAFLGLERHIPINDRRYYTYPREYNYGPGTNEQNGKEWLDTICGKSI